MTTAAEALVRDCANRLDQLFRQDYTMREVEAELRRLLRAALAPPQAGEVEWIALTDEDREAAFRSMPDMLEGFLKTWGWLHFAKEIERRCMEKNVRLLRATQSNVAERAKGVEPTSASSIPEARTPGESPAPSAPAAAMPEIIVSGPVACGKSYVMELIYKALRDAGLHPYSDELAHERRMVDEQPLPPAKVWKLRESIAAPQPDEAVALLREAYNELIVDPEQDEATRAVGDALVERIRAFLKDRT